MTLNTVSEEVVIARSAGSLNANSVCWEEVSIASDEAVSGLLFQLFKSTGPMTFSPKTAIEAILGCFGEEIDQVISNRVHVNGFLG